MLRLAALILLLTLAISCTTNMEEDSLRNEFLINCWTHSMEEDPNGETQVYRERLMIFAEKGEPAFMMRVVKLEEQYAELQSI